MDSLITAAARSLAAGDPLQALKRVALRDDAPALALRGIAMAQLGDFARARDLLRRAARGFGPREPVERARCVVAEAEVALVSRELAWPSGALAAARTVLDKHGDRLNAAHAGCLEARRLLLVGRIGEATRVLDGLDPGSLPPALAAAHALAAAGIAIRRLDITAARTAMANAGKAAGRSGIPALQAEVAQAAAVLALPAARVIARGESRSLRLDEVEALLTSAALVVDACRNVVREGPSTVQLATRPVLFAVARVLAEAWPGEVMRETLVRRAFRARYVDESHRARLRVEIGRLRAELGSLAGVVATKGGYALSLRPGTEVVVLAPCVDDDHPGVLALLADGEAWSSSALALALGTSARTVQRALEDLSRTGRVLSVGRGRSRRWMTPSVPGFPTSLLLPLAPGGG
jgi:hypothetical protein